MKVLFCLFALHLVQAIPETLAALPEEQSTRSMESLPTDFPTLAAGLLHVQSIEFEKCFVALQWADSNQDMKLDCDEAVTFFQIKHPGMIQLAGIDSCSDLPLAFYSTFTRTACLCQSSEFENLPDSCCFGSAAYIHVTDDPNYLKQLCDLADATADAIRDNSLAPVPSPPTGLPTLASLSSVPSTAGTFVPSMGSPTTTMSPPPTRVSTMTTVPSGTSVEASVELFSFLVIGASIGIIFCGMFVLRTLVKLSRPCVSTSAALDDSLFPDLPSIVPLSDVSQSAQSLCDDLETGKPVLLEPGGEEQSTQQNVTQPDPGEAPKANDLANHLGAIPQKTTDVDSDVGMALKDGESADEFDGRSESGESGEQIIEDLAESIKRDVVEGRQILADTNNAENRETSGDSSSLSDSSFASALQTEPIDSVTPAQRARVASLLQENFPQLEQVLKLVLNAYSDRIDELIQELEKGRFPRRIPKS